MFLTSSRTVWVAAVLLAAAWSPARADYYAPRQYYGAYSYHPTYHYSYRSYYYKPYPTYSGYNYHYAICYPSQPQYVYVYNPYSHVYWGRWSLKRDGKPQYSLLAEKDRKGSLSEIPESAFPAPGDPPPVPESKDGLKMELPPDDLPKDLPREGTPKSK
jgi:hypothetical protein